MTPGITSRCATASEKEMRQARSSHGHLASIALQRKVTALMVSRMAQSSGMMKMTSTRIKLKAFSLMGPTTRTPGLITAAVQMDFPAPTSTSLTHKHSPFILMMKTSVKLFMGWNTHSFSWTQTMRTETIPTHARETTHSCRAVVMKTTNFISATMNQIHD